MVFVNGATNVFAKISKYCNVVASVLGCIPTSHVVFLGQDPDPVCDKAVTKDERLNHIAILERVFTTHIYCMYCSIYF